MEDEDDIFMGFENPEMKIEKNQAKKFYALIGLMVFSFIAGLFAGLVIAIIIK